MKIFTYFLNKKITVFNGAILFNVFLWIAFLSLITSEQRVINYYLLGTRRMISIADILFFAISIIFIVGHLKNGNFNDLIKKIHLFWYIFLPLFLLVLLCLVSSTNLSNFSISPYLLGGLGIFMIFSFLLFTKYHEDEILKLVFRYTLIVAFFFLLMYIFTRILRFRPFLYGEGKGTSAVCFPFNSPSQAALFGNVVLMLSVGSALALGKQKWLYAVVPIMMITIFQSGSRSCVWLLVFAWIFYLK